MRLPTIGRSLPGVGALWLLVALAACGGQQADPASTPRQSAPAPTSSPTAGATTALQSPTAGATTIIPQSPTATTATEPVPTPTEQRVATATATEAAARSRCPGVAPVAREASTDVPRAALQDSSLLAGFDPGRYNQYRLELHLDPASATISGTQTLQFTNQGTEPLGDLVFHLYPNLADFGGRLEISCAAVDGQDVAPVLEDDGWVLRLPLPAPLAPEAAAEVTLQFRTTTPTNTATDGYGPFGRSGDLWALASFYPILAMRTEQGWDTLRPNGWGDYVNSDAALYHVQASHPSELQLLASGEVSATCDVASCRSTAAAGPHRDFTMVLVEGWEQLEQTVGHTRVVSSFPAQQREAAVEALALTVDSLTRFNEAFGVYPYAELDILPIPARGFAGVEYPGLIMIGNSFYGDSDNPRMRLQDVVVHEVAHMWWYDIVGNDVLREPWLDEGLTSYAGEYLYPEWIGRSTGALTEARRAGLRRRGLLDVPIDQGVADYADRGAYVGVIYGRAPLFFDALRDELGDEQFFALLQTYAQQNAFGQATTAEFQRLAEGIAGRQLDPFFADWFRRQAE